MLTYKGNPIPVLSIQIDWSTDCRLDENWPGIIREALDTSEERQLHGSRPYYELKFSTLGLSARETGYIRKILESTGTSPVAVPLWALGAYLSANAAAGQLWVDVETSAFRMFDVFKHSILWRNYLTFETFRTFAVDPTRIGVETGLAGAWTTGEKIYPLLIGRVKKPRATSLTDENGVFKVDFEERALIESSFYVQALTGTDVEASEAFIEEGVGGPVL